MRRPTEAQVAAACGTTSAHGTTPLQLLRGARLLRLRPRLRRRMGMRRLLSTLLAGYPTIVLWNSGGAHWSVVVGCDPERRSLVLADPMRRDGMRRVSMAAFARRWSATVAGSRHVGVGIVCRPT